MSELSHFEQESAKTPMRDPLIVLGAAALLPIILFIINLLSPGAAVQEGRELQEGKEAPAAVQIVDDTEI
jgi:hypothetical protein